VLAIAAGFSRGNANVGCVSGMCSVYVTGKGLPGEVEIVQPDRGCAMRVGADCCVMASGICEQFGRLGDVYGKFTRPSSDRGTPSLSEMRASYDTFTTRFEYESPVKGCRLERDLAGARMQRRIPARGSSQRRNWCSISRRNLTASLSGSNSTSSQRSGVNSATARLSLTPCARPSGRPPSVREALAGISLP